MGKGGFRRPHGEILPIPNDLRSSEGKDKDPARDEQIKENKPGENKKKARLPHPPHPGVTSPLGLKTC
jgi:hypothetical protein